MMGISYNYIADEQNVKLSLNSVCFLHKCLCFTFWEYPIDSRGLFVILTALRHSQGRYCLEWHLKVMKYGLVWKADILIVRSPKINITKMND